MSLRDRLRAVGVSDARHKMLGIEAPAKSTEPLPDGVNPAGVQCTADRQRDRELDVEDDQTPIIDVGAEADTVLAMIDSINSRNGGNEPPPAAA